MLPSVTIGIATWRRPQLTRRAVQSVMAQDYGGMIECCVYVDGPDNETPLALSDMIYMGSDRVLHFDRGAVNMGIAYAKNVALGEMGTSDLRGILDSDDYYHPTFVSRCVAELQAHPEVVAVYTDNMREGVYEPATDWTIEALLRCQLRGDCYLARWSALERTQLHDERFELEVDYDLYYQLAQLGPLRRIPEPLMTVTEHAGRTTRDRAKAAYWHAAGLGKYGHSIDWALRRAETHPVWLPAIREGYALGKTMRPEMTREEKVAFLDGLEKYARR